MGLFQHPPTQTRGRCGRQLGSAGPRVAKNGRDGGARVRVRQVRTLEGKKDAVSEGDAGGRRGCRWGRMQVGHCAVDAAGGDSAREHATGGAAHSAGVMPQARTHSQVVQAHSLPLSLSHGLPYDGQSGDSSASPGPTGSSSCIPARGWHEQWTGHHPLLTCFLSRQLEQV